MHRIFRRFAWLLPCLLIVAWVAVAYSFWFLCDDALISFRYARNLAAGHGLRYNLLPGPPVEGFSNFLWVVITAVVFLLGALPEHVIPWVSLASGVALLITAWQVARKRLGLGVEGATWAVALTAFAPAVVIWGTSGLETLPAALALALLFDAWVLDSRDAAGWRGAIFALALALIRTEGVGWVVVILAFAVVMRPADMRRKLRGPLITFLACYTLYFVGRYWYFGTILSNTATAKIHVSVPTLTRGMQYVVGFALADVAWPLTLCLGVWGMALKPRRIGVALLAMAVGPAAYAVIIGGDFMVMGRMLVPGMIFAAWASARVFDHVAKHRSIMAWGLRAAGIGLVVLHLLPLDNRAVTPESWRKAVEVRTNTKAFRTEYQQWEFQKNNATRWGIAGLAIKEATRPGDAYVLGAIGAVGYSSDLTIYDRYGLVTPSVAKIDVDEAHIHRSPGHDTFVQVTFFVDQHPTVLYATQLHGDNAYRAAPRNIKRWRRYARYQYAPTLTRTVVNDKVIWVLALRYFPTMAESNAMWTAFAAASDSLSHGKIPTSSPIFYPSRTEAMSGEQGT